jgi:MoaA/NifB/PqqE/SkfB family radical SAM enzyme
MTKDTFETLRSRVEASSLKRIIFSGFGEPLLHPMLPQYISQLKEVFPGVIHVNTNAGMLSRDLARDLVASGLDNLNVSYNGPEPEDYETVMRGMSFKTLEENIAGFIQARGKRPKPRLSLQSSMPDVMKTEKRLMRIASLLNVERVKFYGFNNRAGNLEPAAESPAIPLMDRFCSPILFVAWDGILYPCSHDIKGRQPLGHVLDVAFDEIEKEDYPICRGCTVCDAEGMKEFKVWRTIARQRLRRILG